MAALTFFDQHKKKTENNTNNNMITVYQNDVDKMKSLLSSINDVVVKKTGRKEFYTDLTDGQAIAEIAAEVKNKALTGAADNSGLGSTRTENKFPFDAARVDIAGGDVYRGAGAMYLPEQVVGWTGAGFTGIGEWTAATSGTAYTDDALTTPTTSKTINLGQYKIKMPVNIWQMLNNYAGSTAQLVSFLTEMAEIKKGFLRDNLVTTDITTNASGVAANGASQFALALTVYDMIRAIRANSGAQSPRLGVFANQTGVAKLQSEQDSAGNFKNSDNINMDPFVKFTPTLVNGVQPAYGQVGIMSGVPVFQTESVLNTYTAVGNDITAQTGGANTAIVVADINNVAVLSGRSEFDSYQLFTPENSLTANNLSQYILQGHTIAGGGIAMDTKARYHTLAA